MQLKQKTKKRGHTFNRYIRRTRERVTESRESSNGPSRVYVVQKEGSRKLRHDGVATCHEKRGKLDLNGDVAAPRVRTGDSVVFADGRSAVEAVEVHRSWSLKVPAVSVAVK